MVTSSYSEDSPRTIQGTWTFPQSDMEGDIANPYICINKNVDLIKKKHPSATNFKIEFINDSYTQPSYSNWDDDGPGRQFDNLLVKITFTTITEYTRTDKDKKSKKK